MLKHNLDGYDRTSTQDRIVDEIPQAVNPITQIGVGTTGTVSNVRGIRNPRAFSPDEMNRVTTHTRLELPFALHGMTGEYTVGKDCRVRIEILQKPKDIAGYNIGLPEVNEAGKHMTLDPDNWGFVNYTCIVVSFVGCCPIQSPEDVDPHEHDLRILKGVTGTVNPLIDAYTLATENYSIHRVSPRDFVRYEAWHTLDGHMAEFNRTSVHFPNSNFRFKPPETQGDLELMKNAIAFLKLDKPYTRAYQLYAEATRALVGNDPRLASVQAMCSVETALFHYIEALVSQKRDDSRLKRISKTAYDEIKVNLTCSISLRLVFPLLVPDHVAYPKDAVDACNRLRKRRNDAVHDPSKFDGRVLMMNCWQSKNCWSSWSITIPRAHQPLR